MRRARLPAATALVRQRHRGRKKSGRRISSFAFRNANGDGVGRFGLAEFDEVVLEAEAGHIGRTEERRQFFRDLWVLEVVDDQPVAGQIARRVLLRG